MKRGICILACFLSVAGYCNARQNIGEFAATLPNGATVELIGLSYHSPGAGLSQSKPWWLPDGSDLPGEPYRHPRKGTGTGTGSYAREFAMRITGVEDYSCATYNSLGRSNVQPVVPLDENNQSVPGVLAFVCRFKDGQFEDTIRIGVSTEPWQKVEEWVDDAWHKHDHDNIVFRKSENPLILTWPRQKGRAVILEMVRTDVAEARRMLLFDRDDQVHEENPRLHGEGPGIVKEQYWFWNIQREDMHRIEFQTRPYQWVEFRNVSLQLGRKTNVETAVLATKDKLARGLSVSEQEKESLGYVLHRLAENLRFPAKGRATYQIEERDAQGQEPRVLRCKYGFEGILYGLEVVTVRTGSTLGALNVNRYFDGQESILWIPRENVATLWEGRRQRTPIYRLQRFCPTEILKELLSHEVELKGSGDINGIPCSLLECVISSKDRLKLWLAKEPDVYPLRIERYEYDNLRYVYESENIKSWNGIPFPEKIKQASYRTDDALEHIFTSSYVVSVESFMPDGDIAAQEFAPKFPPDTSVNKYASAEPQATDFNPTIPLKHLRQFAGIDIEFNVDQAEGKMILVCFFDMNQRPSRNCIRELAKREEELKEKGVTVVAVQTSKVNEDRFNEWMKEHSVPFPIGMVQGDVEKTRFAWGVHSLPWLILTDRRHIVCAEGFGFEELGEKIKESNDVEE
jgi:hypothetical protein